MHIARRIVPHVASGTLPLNNLASDVFSRMWSDLSSDMRPSIKPLLDLLLSTLGRDEQRDVANQAYMLCMNVIISVF